MQAKLCLIILFDLHHDFQSQAEPDLLVCRSVNVRWTCSSRESETLIGNECCA